MIQHTDADELFELVSSNREYLRHWLPWLDYNKSVDDTKSFIKNSLSEYANNKSMVHVIVDQQIVGVCGYNSFNPSIKAGYIGYWIAEKHQGKGLITSACKELENIGFGQLNLNKIEIHVAAENTKSRKVAENLKYTETGKIIDAEWLYDHYVDHIIYCKKMAAINGVNRTSLFSKL